MLLNLTRSLPTICCSVHTFHQLALVIYSR
uniref:Uncharacterized protein n=1 Tax=Anguilla anguilla TaxID=7936 RepID=A0A0E9Q4W3_ANGAN